MANRRSKQRSAELETRRVVDEALLHGDTLLLRRVAAVRGLVSSSLRTRVWPVLLGVDVRTRWEPCSGGHQDENVVAVDVQRSLWCIADDHQREVQRAALLRVLNGVVSKHSGLHYWQGLHQICAVLLVTTGSEALSAALLERMLLYPLHSCAAKDLGPVLNLLDLVFPLLARCDPELERFFRASGLMPHFALSWLLTWHAHTTDVQGAARLFDLFLSSSPLLPLYVGVVALAAQRDKLLGMPCDGPQLHQYLSHLDVLACLPPQELVVRSLALHRRIPPLDLCSHAGVSLPQDSPVLAWPYPWLSGCAAPLEKSTARRVRMPPLRQALTAALLTLVASGAARLMAAR
jgi:hypothetical protein